MEEELKLFVDTLLKYFKSRGSIILGFMKASKQNNIKIEFHGLYHYFRSNGKYTRFMDLYRSLREKYGDRLNIYGYEVILKDEYIIVPKNLIRCLLDLK